VEDEVELPVGMAIERVVRAALKEGVVTGQRESRCAGDVIVVV
jgi:hypothetical protein